MKKKDIENICYEYEPDEEDILKELLPKIYRSKF